MNQSEAISWFQEVATFGATLPKESERHYAHQQVAQWVAQASSAIHGVFPPGHHLLKRWDDCLKDHVGEKSPYLNGETFVETLRGTFLAAQDLLAKGRLSSFVEGIRTETVADLLDQADVLARQNFVAAATVVAGGALETFLHFTCDKNALITWEGHGSIEKYKDALARARKNGNEIISASDEKQVSAWGGSRNDAAHDPGSFHGTVDSVKLMIEGIRQFIGRYAK